ncbi:hypothetical protein [Pyrodictium abyssi]|uniref:Uncharacterized protein n=1 Tax=Pyrodictium abyssi TaxID=54256 RepID=A0ABM8IU27_9CREN|nr:hypothetical protein PABY_06340 [Pyrodictium abyssi]
MARLRILVEGCLDAALAEWLAGKAGVDAEAELAGGWTGVVRQTVGLAASRATILGIIDADAGVDKRVQEVIRVLERHAKRRGLAVETRLKRGPQPPPLLEVTVVSQGARRTSYISFWCSGSPCRGTVEDVLGEMLEEKYSYEPAEAPQACSRCPSSRCSRDYAKYEPVLFLAACAGGGGTPVLVPAERHCGIDVRAALDKLDLADTPAARRYQQLIRSIIARQA